MTSPQIPDGLRDDLAALNLTIVGTAVSELNTFFVYFQYVPSREQEALNVFTGATEGFFDVAWDDTFDDFAVDTGDGTDSLRYQGEAFGLDPDDFHETVQAVMQHFTAVIEHATMQAAVELNTVPYRCTGCDVAADNHPFAPCSGAAFVAERKQTS